MGFNAHEISIVITDDVQIQKLNHMYRNINKATNVLAFPMQEGQFADITPGLLGDVVISCDTALKEADTAQITLTERISQLLVHGILHLAGFDHEDDESCAQMEDKSLELIRQIEANTDLNSF